MSGNHKSNPMVMLLDPLILHLVRSEALMEVYKLNIVSHEIKGRVPKCSIG